MNTTKTLNSLHEVISLRDFLQSFGIDVVEERNGVFRGKCPIHNGNNPSAFVMYTREDGGWSWACHTHDCHEVNGNNVIGLIASLKNLDIAGAMYLINKKFKLKIDRKTNVVTGQYVPKFASAANKRLLSPIQPPISIPVDKSLLVKASKNVFKTDYFKKLNISIDIINRFNLGFSEESNRIFIPIFDNNNIFVGYNTRCTDDKFIDTIDIDGNAIVRYKSSAGFKKRNFLYGRNLIGEKINKVVLVEGFKNVWFLDSIGIPAVSIFGHSLSPQQLYLLKEMTNNVIICFDNDVDETNKNAGQDGAKKVHKILSVNKINAINVCPPPNKDIGDAFTDETMKEWIKSTLENEYA